MKVNIPFKERFREQYRARLANGEAKPSKYHNRRTVVDGVVLDSQREANRYAELLLLEKAGEIEGLEVHPRFDLQVNGVKIGTYVADFQYFDKRTNRSVVEDVKGVKTTVYQIKKRLVKALYFRDIVEV